MIDKNRQGAGRIPVRFVDEDRAGGADDKTPDELGRESAYDDETEMQRRVDEGRQEGGGGGRGGDRGQAGGPPRGEMPENREDLDTNPRSAAAYDDAGPEAAEDSDGAVEIDAGESLLSSQAELFAAQDEARALAAEVEALKAERQSLRELLARRQADFENSRKRMERERSETYQRVVADVVGQLLPVVDNLRRALDAEASVEANESEEFRHFLSGVELIGKQLTALLERLGVEPVPTVGRPFDPHVHEAIATEQSDEFAPDTVVQEVQRGYRLGDKLIRPAMVKVATKQ